MLLTGTGGEVKGRSWPLGEDGVSIGRGLSNTIVLADGMVSRRHCEVVAVEGVVQLRDLGSNNATLVNGTPRHSCALTPGDEIAVGAAVFVLSEEERVTRVARNDSANAKTHEIADSLIHAAGSLRADTTAIGRVRTVADLHLLVTLGRALGHVASFHDLPTAIDAALQDRFPDCEIAVVRYHGNAEDFTVFAQPDSSDWNGRGPDAQIIRRIYGEAGPLRANESTNLRSHRVACAVRLGADTIAALLMRTRTPVDESDADFFAAVAYQLGPFIVSVEQLAKLQLEADWLRATAQASTRLLGESDPIVQVKQLVAKVAPTTLPVLILGETGTGKELVARMLHERSARAHGPLIIVNCAAIPANLMESEMFGFEKGAFSGAERRRIGRLEQAHGGTLFLDEVGDLSLDNQARILRAIELGTFHRVGGANELRVDVRVLAATHRDLRREVDLGNFREDLYHRIAGFEVDVPPLRERPTDIPLLAMHFLHESASNAKKTLSGFQPSAIAHLASRPWTGNVRELRNWIERAVVLAPGDIIRVEDLEAAGLRREHSPSSNAAARSLADVERDHIQRILRECNGNITAAARVLGIHRSTLHAKITDYGL